MPLKLGRFRSPHGQLTPPRTRTVVNIHTSVISPETKVSGEHLCPAEYGSIFIRFHILLSEAEKSSQADNKNRF